MLEAADARQGHDPGPGREGRGFGFTAGGSVAHRSVDPLRVVIVDVLAEQRSWMVLAEYDDVVEKLAANAAHEALSSPVLPRALERRAFRSDAETLDEMRDLP